MNFDSITHLPDVGSNFSERNKRLVLSEILLRGPLPRTEIAERVRLTPASVSRITRNLINTGLVEETDPLVSTETRPGRRRIGVKARSDGGFVVGIAINAFQQDIVISNITNGDIDSKQLHFPSLSQADDVLETCAFELSQLIERSGIDRSRLFGCGIAITGAIDNQRNQIRHAPVLGWNDVNVQSLTQRWLDVPVVMESIPNAKNLAAHCFGPSRDISNVVLFNCSLAIGSSLMVDNVVLRGIDSNVGLIESMLIPDEESDQLRPIDIMAGGFGVIGKAMTTSKNALLQAEKLTEAIKDNGAGNVSINRTLAQAGRSLAYAVAVTNALLHPELILLSGPLIQSSVYCQSIQQRARELMDSDTVAEKIKFYPLSSGEAARSLAIHHFLAQDGFSWATRN